MKMPAAHLKQTTGTNTPADFTLTAQNLSKYATKKLAQAIDSLTEEGYQLERADQGFILVSKYGMRKSFHSQADVIQFVRGAV